MAKPSARSSTSGAAGVERMRRLVVLTAMLFVAMGVFVPRVAVACMNATISPSSAEARLRDADQALEEGDVLTARELSEEVIHAYARLPDDAEPPRLDRRAVRAHALSFVRDPKANSAELQAACGALKKLLESPAGALDVELQADYGEALERTGRVDEAYAVLLPLMRRDLVGSSYALASLSRAAAAKGDQSNAALAAKTCQARASNPASCKEYPARPIVRGRPIDFAFPAFVFLGAALVRLVRRKRPWSGFAARSLAAVVGVTALAVALLANVRYGIPAAAIALLVAAAVGSVQQRLFFRAVRAGRVPSFVLRPSTEDEETSPPSTTLGFLFGPRVPELLEAVGEGGYRDNARVAGVARIVRRNVPPGLVVFFISLVFLFAGCAAAMTLTRSMG